MKYDRQAIDHSGLLIGFQVRPEFAQRQTR